MPKKRGSRHPYKALSDASCRSLKPGMHLDGNGLYLRVQPSGSRQWIQRLIIHKRPRMLGLGGYPLVTLAEAREKALSNRKNARAGGDPLEEKRMHRDVPAFRVAAERVIEFRAKAWSNTKHAKQWSSSLERYVYPTLGDLLVSQITTADVLNTLVPIWHEKPETARRVRQRIGTVMDWAVAKQYRIDNPCGTALTATLPNNKRPQRHHRALPYQQVAEAIATVNGSDAYVFVKLAFEFLVHTAGRSGEVRLATWDEVNLDAGVWTIPDDRMKGRRSHRVPLSPRALDILKTAQSISPPNTRLVFPGPTKYNKPLSDATLSKLIRERGIAAVPHGFRSSFRDWAAESTNMPREVVEAALAHVVKDKAEAAYARSDLFDKRRNLMDKWSKYLQS